MGAVEPAGGGGEAGAGRVRFRALTRSRTGIRRGRTEAIPDIPGQRLDERERGRAVNGFVAGPDSLVAELDRIGREGRQQRQQIPFGRLEHHASALRIAHTEPCLP